MKNFKQIKVLISLTLIIIFLIHSGHVIYRLALPQLPSTRNYELELGDMQFPITFRICLYELKNRYGRYRNMGYKNVWKFFKELEMDTGMSMR